MRRVEFIDQVSKKKMNGMFHQFSIDCKETNDGYIQFPVAIIESDNGNVYSIHVEQMQFQDLNNLTLDEKLELLNKI